MTARRAALLAALALFLALAWDGRLYWHEVRYLYATAHYPLEELVAGVWNPQFGMDIDPASSGAFYLLKAGFLGALRLWWNVVPPERGGFLLAGLASLLAAAAAAGMARSLISRLPGAPSQAADGTAILLLLSPLLPYLAGKVLAEPFALAFALAALLALERADAASRRRDRLLLVGAAAVAYLAAISCRANISLLVIGALLAAGALPRFARRRARLATVSMAAVLVQAGYLAAAVRLSGIGWAGLSGHLADFASHRGPAMVSILGGLLACGTLAPLAACGAAGGRPSSRFLVLWLAFSGLPTLLGASLYQVEARYLVAPLVPLAGLAWEGVERLARPGGERTPERRSRRWQIVLVAATAAVSALALPFLPYELERRPLQALLEAPELAPGSAPLLVPWAYTDFHYLVTLWPERPILMVHVPRMDGTLRPYSTAWRARLAAWYGERFLPDREALSPWLARGPVYYLSWGHFPPLETWSRRLRRAGFEPLARRLLELAPVDHGTASWVVEDPGLELEEVRRSGPYTLMRVVPAGEPAPAL